MRRQHKMMTSIMRIGATALLGLASTSLAATVQVDLVPCIIAPSTIVSGGDQGEYGSSSSSSRGCSRKADDQMASADVGLFCRVQLALNFVCWLITSF